MRLYIHGLVVWCFVFGDSFSLFLGSGALPGKDLIFHRGIHAYQNS
jgi:hypothetical protein